MLEEAKVSVARSDLDKLVTVVIPTLNEESGIVKVIEELHSMGLSNILVIDGYSTDKTTEVAARLGARVTHQHGKGKTGALMTAIDNVQTPYMVVMDGDFTYDARSISRLIEHMKTHDEVIGARVPTSGKSMTALHKFGNAIITRVFNSLMSTNLSDVCSGMYLLKMSAASDIHLATTGFDVEAEIAAQIALSGSIAEVPVDYRPRVGRQKLSTWKHGFRIVSTIFGLAKTYNPGVYYSMLGAFLIVPAVFMLADSALELTATGRLTSPWFFIGISMVLVAIQAMGVGVVSLMVKRSELRSARKLAKILEKS